MSGGPVCSCPGTTAERRARWVVFRRRCNYSAFSGYHHTPSRYSGVACLLCGRIWRSRAAFVDRLPDKTIDEVRAEVARQQALRDAEDEDMETLEAGSEILDRERSR